ncbi:hypothetical protein [Neobacillus drentensis]|uniref:hypothetical protein n=1 Tax=Neobacillus drentensis TaxID=220684 RepID=UPI002FFE8E98
MIWKLSHKKYPHIYIILNQLKNRANYGDDVKIFVDYSVKYYSGTAVTKTTIFLSKKIFAIQQQDSITFNSILAHEFAHVVNGDTLIQGIKDKRYDNHSRNLINIIKEIRAEIVGASLMRFKPKDINHSQNTLLKLNQGSKNIKEVYKGMYPTRVQIKYFAKRYSQLNKDIINYFINSYFKHMKITDIKERKTIRNNVLDRFI